jgi:hypothetical protein
VSKTKAPAAFVRPGLLRFVSDAGRNVISTEPLLRQAVPAVAGLTLWVALPALRAMRHVLQGPVPVPQA